MDGGMIEGHVIRVVAEVWRCCLSHPEFWEAGRCNFLLDYLSFLGRRLRRILQIELLLLMRVSACDKGQKNAAQSNIGLPLTLKTQWRTCLRTRTQLLISKLMVSSGSHPKATGVWEKRFLEKGFIIRTLAH